MSSLTIIILAAGKGTRMNSDLAKVLHPLAGKPMVLHLMHTAQALQPTRTVVVTGHQADDVEATISAPFPTTQYVRQTTQQGTGHAVLQAKDLLQDFSGTTLILYGDAPLIPTQALSDLIQHHQQTQATVTVLTTTAHNPTGFGRIIRNSTGQLLGSVEEKNCTPEQRQITEVNTGIFAVNNQHLWPLLAQVQPSPPKNEYYLTDILHLAVQKGLKVEATHNPAGWVLLGVNDLAQLAAADDLWQQHTRARMLKAGVSMPAPHTVHFHHDTHLAPGTRVEPYVVFGPGVNVATGTHIKSFSHLEGCTIGASNHIGPYTRIRPGTTTQTDVHLGNFVEAKNATLAKGTKANHLSYVGDIDVGACTNLGAGFIHANYNHGTKQKFRSAIGENVSTGAHTTIVGPVTVDNNATIGAGSTIRKNVPAGALAATKSEQVVKPNYTPKKK